MLEKNIVDVYYIILRLLRFFFIFCCIGEKVKLCFCLINIIFKVFVIKLEFLKIVLIVRIYGLL